MKTEPQAVDSQRNDPLLTIECCNMLNSSDENERTLEDLCECLHIIFEELKSKVELLPDLDDTSETHLNDKESLIKLYYTVNNVEKLIQDVKRRMMKGNLPKDGLHQDRISTDDVRNKRDSGISSLRGSSQVSSASLSDIGLDDCNSKNVTSPNAHLASLASEGFGLSEECTSRPELCYGITSLDQTDTRDGVHFFLEPKDDVGVPLSQNVLYRIQVISKENDKVRLCLIPCGVDTVPISAEKSLGEKYECTLPSFNQETASESRVETIPSMHMDRRHAQKDIRRHFPHLERQNTVEYSSSASLKQDYTQEIPTRLVQRQICECGLCRSTSPCASVNNLSRFAVQHSECSEDDNTRQVCTQISSSSSGSSICRIHLSRPVTCSVDTQTEEVIV